MRSSHLSSSPTIRGHLLEVLQDNQDLITLRLQLAVTLDAGKPFVTSTYDLEGDGEVIVTAYRRLQEATAKRWRSGFADGMVGWRRWLERFSAIEVFPWRTGFA